MSTPEDTGETDSGPANQVTSRPAPEGPFVTLAKIHDPVTAHLLEEVLRQEGASVSVLGTKDGASIGVGQLILDRRFEVPESQLEWAKAIMRDLLANDQQLHNDQMPPELTADELIPAEPSEEANQDTDTPPQKQPLRALGLALYPGFAHWYVRQPWTGVFVLLGILSAVHNYPVADMPLEHGLILYGIAVAFGVVVGLRESLRSGGPKEWSPFIQIAVGGAFAAALNALVRHL